MDGQDGQDKSEKAPLIPADSFAISPRVIYSSHYNIGVFGLERLHPFDSRKFGRAWNLLRSRFEAFAEFEEEGLEVIA